MTLELSATKEIYLDPQEMAKLQLFGFTFDDGFIMGSPEIELTDIAKLAWIVQLFEHIMITKTKLVILNL